MDLMESIADHVPKRLWNMADSPLRMRLARGAFWSVFNAGFTRCFALLASIVVARVVGRELFGEFGVVQGTVGVFALFAGLGMSATATKYVAELRHKDPLRTGRIIGLSMVLAMLSALVMSIALIATAPWLARTTLASVRLGPLLRLGTGLLCFGVLNGAMKGALYGFEAFKSIAIIDVVTGLVGCAMVIGGVFSRGLPGAILGLVGGAAAQSLGYWIAFRRETQAAGISNIYRGCFAEWSVLAQFSLPALLAAAMAGPVNWLCSAIVVNQPGGYAQMGLFSAANQWRSAIMFLPLTVSYPFLPVLSSMFGTDRRRYSKVLRTGIAVNGFLALFAAIIVAILSHSIMASYGEDFVAGRAVLVLLSFSAVLTASATVVGHAIASSGRMWWGFALNTVWAITLISSVWVLRSRGAYGFAVANLIAYSVHLVTSSAYVISQIPQQLAAFEERPVRV